MANHLRGEADFFFEGVDGEEYSFVLSYNNQAKMQIEQELHPMDRTEMLQRFLMSQGEDARIRFVLFRHGIRKHHRKEFKDPNKVHEILEEFDYAKASAEDDGEGLRIEFISAVLSAFDRKEKQTLVDTATGEIEPDEEDDLPKPKGKEKTGDRSPSEAGSSS